METAPLGTSTAFCTFPLWSYFISRHPWVVTPQWGIDTTVGY